MSLKYHDLKGTILSEISLDEYEPKSGDDKDVIVIAFFSNDQGPADDLNTYIQRGFIEILDVEVSPSTDDQGRYLVFVEMNREPMFPNKFQALVRDIENVTGSQNWKVKTYLSNDSYFDFNDPALYNYIIVDPDQYVSKEEFTVKDQKEKVKEFFKNSPITGLLFEKGYVIISSARHKIAAEIVDIGEYDAVIGRNFLSESAFNLDKKPYEMSVLQSIVSNCQVLPMGKFFVVGNDNHVLLLKNTQII